jgi:hypothetical protein
VIDHKELAVRLNELERRVTNQDGHIKALFQAVRELMTPPESKKRKIGFLVKERAARYGRVGSTSATKVDSDVIQFSEVLAHLSLSSSRPGAPGGITRIVADPTG